MRLLHKTTFPHKTALRFMLLVLGLFVMFLSNPTEVSAQSISGVAEPLNHTQPNPDFEDILAPEGGWISTTADEFCLADNVQHPSRRVGVPSDIANMALYLCSEKAVFIKGENIIIDGGMSKQMIYHNDHSWKLEA